MKKTLYSIFCASAILFSACSEDRGTTTEVADANQDEYVNPSHLGGNMNQDFASTGGFETEEDYLNRSREIATRMATDMNLDEGTQDRVAAIFFERDKMLGDIDNSYNFSATNRMGGQTSNDTETDLNNNATDPANTSNADNTSQNNETLKENDAQLTEMRSTIIEDANKDLRAVLTEEQYNEYIQNRAKYDHASLTTDDKNMSNETQMNKNKSEKTTVESNN